MTRPEFVKMLDVTCTGNMIVVWRLDRLGRSLELSGKRIEVVDGPGLSSSLLTALLGNEAEGIWQFNQ